MKANLIITVAVLVAAVGAMADEVGDTAITGFVDASYSRDITEGHGEFGLDQVEVDIVHQASDRVLLRADVEWIKDGDDFIAQVEQGYMSYTLPHGWSFTFGKFNAPIGFELLDPPDMYQYSHALVFDYGLPTNLTGFSLAKDLGHGLDFIGHVSNGWDANAATGKHVTWGGRLGLTYGGFSGGVSGISGREDADDDVADPFSFKRTVFDVDLKFEQGNWVVGGELNQGRVTIAEPDAAAKDWHGFLLMTHVDLVSWMGLTVRYGSFDDADGWALPEVDGQPQKIQSLTVCPTFVLHEGFTALVEVRVDSSNRDGFTDEAGQATSTRTVVAFEMTYSW
jgi:hypothetical protein